MVPPSSLELCADSPSTQPQTRVKPELSTIGLVTGGAGGDSGRPVSGYGVKLKWLRSSTGLTQEAFADVVGVASRSLSVWENETNPPSRSNVKLIARHFGIPPAELADFLEGTGHLVTIPTPMRDWLAVPRISNETTVGELSKLAGPT